MVSFTDVQSTNTLLNTQIPVFTVSRNWVQAASLGPLQDLRKNDFIVISVQLFINNPLAYTCAITTQLLQSLVPQSISGDVLLRDAGENITLDRVNEIITRTIPYIVTDTANRYINLMVCAFSSAAVGGDNCIIQSPPGQAIITAMRMRPYG